MPSGLATPLRRMDPISECGRSRGSPSLCVYPLWVVVGAAVGAAVLATRLATRLPSSLVMGEGSPALATGVSRLYRQSPTFGTSDSHVWSLPPCPWPLIGNRALPLRLPGFILALPPISSSSRPPPLVRPTKTRTPDLFLGIPFSMLDHRPDPLFIAYR
jgi:hypothetical protein